MLAVEPTTAIGYPFVDYVAAQDSDRFLQHVRQCVSECTEVTSEFTLVSRGGKSIPVQLRSIPITDPDGSVSLCKTAVTDLTDRKRAEEALRASERNYREIFDAVNEMIVVHEVESGAILDANVKTCETFGYSREEIRELTVGHISLGKPPYAQEDAANWLAKTAQEGPQRFEWLCKKKNDDLFWVEVNLKRAVIGGVDRLLAVVREITERKQREEELRLAHQKLIEHERERQRVEAELASVKEQLGRQKQ
jgi:PAS domain S-box-containing protein